MNIVKIFTDGACSGNPGPGGWGAILKSGEHCREISGGEKNTTNNRMEITAVIKALEALKKSCEVEIYSDSQYVCNAINNGWAKKWKQNNWMKNRKDSVLNSDLWEILLNLLEKHTAKFIWIRGHSGHSENERCDRLAVQAVPKY